ncbi:MULTISPECIES: hypothetical protein [Burkholderia]|uniref:hypothetical protein n=1 Tax=Burkholderia TaxID=32008 RepID=UPI000B7AD524|nr:MULTISPECIES: hypothetical protein [Burkholderia]MBY4728003.1 hypothetical protein [Burkholderia contaminans]MCI3969228.1 hypothetical protein [Burkholderia sp. HI4860]OXI98459.1 hypothetical protein CFB48_23970 [Burkholderia sp. AU33647]
MATNKAVVTFGIRGDRCSGQHVLPIKAAAKLAKQLSWVFGRDESDKTSDFLVSRKVPRQSWQSSTHYVSLQLLTGDGDASAALWRKEV